MATRPAPHRRQADRRHEGLFKTQISLDTVLVLVGMLAAGIAAFYSLKSDVAVIQSTVSTLQSDVGKLWSRGKP